MTDPDHLRATGGRIDAATDTAAFVRQQMARGVSAETLRRRLRIPSKHMIQVLMGHAPEPPMRGPSAAQLGQQTSVRLGMPPTSVGLSNAEIAMRAAENRAIANRLARLVVPTVVKITRFDRGRIEGPEKTDAAQDIRSMVFALMHELSPQCPLQAIGAAIGQRQAVVVERALARCHRLRQVSTEFNEQYLRAVQSCRKKGN